MTYWQRYRNIHRTLGFRAWLFALSPCVVVQVVTIPLTTVAVPWLRLLPFGVIVGLLVIPMVIAAFGYPEE